MDHNSQFSKIKIKMISTINLIRILMNHATKYLYKSHINTMVKGSNPECTEIEPDLF